MQQVEIKNDGQNSKNKQPATHAIIFVYFSNFFSSRCFFATFLLFQLFFYIFLQTGNTRDGSTKSFSLNRVKIWSTKNQARSLKSV
jgi:hypothetical protein